MKFIVDESSDARIASYLTSQGHDAIFVAARFGPGLADDRILSIAHSEDRIIVTDDRDFAELVYRDGLPHRGVIYFRLKDTLWDTRLARLRAILDHHAHQLDHFLVVTDSRVRPGPPPRSR